MNERLECLGRVEMGIVCVPLWITPPFPFITLRKGILEAWILQWYKWFDCKICLICSLYIYIFFFNLTAFYSSSDNADLIQVWERLIGLKTVNYLRADECGALSRPYLLSSVSLFPSLKSFKINFFFNLFLYF